jgi:hypothetical protein
VSESTPVFNNFIRGEVGDVLHARIDLADYAQALSICENALISQQGQVIKRPGSYYVASSKANEKIRLIPYERSDNQNYVIELGNLYARFYTNGARIEDPPGTPVEIVTPWPVAELYKLQFFQEYDKLYFVHPGYACRMMKREGTDLIWSLLNYNVAPFNSAGNYPKAGCFWQGRLIFAGTNNNPTAVWGSMVGSYTTWATWSFDIDAAPTPGDFIIGATLTGGASGATAIVVSKITNINYVVKSLTGNFRYAETISDGTNSRVCGAGWPRVMPSVTESDPWMFTIAADRAMTIQWVSSGNDLLVGTTGGEWLFTGGESMFYAGNFLLRRQTRLGSAYIQPVSFGSRCLYVQKTLETLRVMAYELQKDSYEAPDMTLTHPEIMLGGVAHLESQVTPSQRMWSPRLDGWLLSFGFEPDSGFAAWSRHSISGGSDLIESCAIITSDKEDQIWLSVKYGSSRYICYLRPMKWATNRDCFFVDMGRTFDYGPAKTVNYATQTAPIQITCYGHGFKDDDKVKFADIGGMTRLNGGFYTVKNKTTDTFDLYDEAGSDWVDGGMFELEVDTAPSPAAWEPGATVWGGLSGNNCEVIQEVVGSSSKKYICTGASGPFTDGEVLSDGTNSVDCAPGYPKSKYFYETFTSPGKATGHYARLTGLTHLDGRIVDILVDGANHPKRTVSSGIVLLQTWGNKVQVGLPYTAKMRLMRMAAPGELGAGLGKKKRISKVLIGFINTITCQVGPDEDHLTEIVWRNPEDYMDAAPAPFSGFKETSFKGTWEKDGWVLLLNDQPNPWTINMIMPYLEVKDL